MLKVFWQAKAKLFLLTQVAWSRVTDDTDGTDGVADILHSYSSMKTLNWRLIVPEGGETLNLFIVTYKDKKSQEESALWSLEETNRVGGGGWELFGLLRMREATQTWEINLQRGVFHSLSFCLVILLWVEGKKKKLLKSRHNHQDSPSSYTLNKTEPFCKVNWTTQKMLPYRHAWKSIVSAQRDMNKHTKKESIRNILLF